MLRGTTDSETRRRQAPRPVRTTAPATRAQKARERLKYYAAIEAALTREVQRKARAYATRRCAMLAAVGVPADPDELLWDAVGDTLQGKRPWDPDARSLAAHLYGTIRSRTKAAYEHARSFPKAPIADLQDDSGADAAIAELSATPAVATARADTTRRFLQALYAAAQERNDRTVIGLLDAYRDGITRRADVAAHIGVRVKQYDHARDRLTRMVAKLSDTLAAEAAEVMRNQ